ncbi:MAG TPA: SRPBCC family protein [Gaiellales bacterium]|jgi:uncharacterized protein YndB with AHSA1/START domain
MNGTLEQAGAQWRLRFRRELAHPAGDVWSAITEPARRAAWFPDEVDGDFTTAGSPLTFTSPSGVFHGEVTACEPPTLLELLWGTDRLRFELAPTGAGCTLTLTDTFDERGKAARDGAGWHECLDDLGHALDGMPAPPQSERWQELHAAYVEALGPEASTIGPPADWQPAT